MNIDTGSYENIVNSLLEGFYIVDQNKKIIFWNSAAEDISGFKSQEMVGRPCSDDMLTQLDSEGNKLRCENCPLAASIDDSRVREAKLFFHHKEGHRIPVAVRTSSLKDKGGNVVGGIELFSDISKLEAYKGRVKELEKLALIDELTQLPNRHCINRELSIRLAELKRYAIPFGVLMLDIDFFKKYNDQYGHDFGDKTLKFISKTILSSCRPFDFYGRWGGEEFLGILRNIDVKGLETVGRRIRLLIESSYLEKDGEQLHVTVSIGATLASLADSEELLFQRVDRLMYQSKQNGRNCLTSG